MKKLIFLLSALLVMCFTGIQGYAAPGDLINIQLGASPFYDNGAAINDLGNQYWNYFAATDQATWAGLRYSTALSSGASLEYNMTGTTGLDDTGTAFPDGGIDTPLMRGYVSTDNFNTGTLDIKGLTAGTYTVYVYSQIDKDQTSSLNMTANGVNFTLTNNGSLTELSQNKNWTAHDVVVGAGGTINMSFGTGNQINGIQLLQAVPEPGSLALIGVGSILALGIKRLKSKEESAVA
ncbi:MAG: PEP-CTERM sorting domain-containing protein [Chlorobaculum sp.]|nr:PEP-CTERM sorting domain-containing protein [Chlorobaculum sp.]